ncbi:MAG: nucleoside-diphosphate kinase [Elusimicrobiota bacterium]|nr:nucleoside-diphosphate kinase [Elusimicrobiota bacterium]MDH5662821.1 nucleoside-diphosphate kinase [Elusimicrobiota bacterium]
MERTLVIIKPDALSKKIAGKVITTFEKKGFKIVAFKMVLLSREKAEEFYEEHKGKEFYEPLVNFMSSNPCLVMVLEGEDVTQEVRDVAGNTDPQKAEPGTLRELYAQDNRHNILHAADSLNSAERELKFFFSENEIHHWEEKTYKK